MKPLIALKGNPSGQQKARGRPAYAGVLAACVAGVVWGNVVWGNEPSPTPIANAEQLNSTVREHPEGNYVLTGDIYLNVTYSPWLPIGSLNQPFNGTLDGNNHFVHGLNVNTTANNQPAGLFGRMADSKVHNLVIVRPRVESHGNGSPAGAIAGEIERSNVTDSINYSGQVTTEGGWTGTYPEYRYSAAGGLVGWTKDSSRVESNLNTGEVRTSGTDAYAGGVVGGASTSSKISGNLNMGEVRTSGSYADAGGALGRVHSSTISGNLNTGGVRTSGNTAAAGGAAGRAICNSISSNLNTGEVRTSGNSAGAGGAVGVASSSSEISGNLNTGEVRTTGSYAYAGGAAGGAYSSTISGNLNTGGVHTTRSYAAAGGAAGRAILQSIVSGNLNTGEVRTSGSHAYAGGTAGAALFSSKISGNLNTGGVFTNGTNADAGGAVGMASSSTISGNLNTGEIIASNSSANSLGVISSNGGFACSEESVTTPATTEPMTMATPSTKPLTGNCPAPVGIPDFQVFDPSTERLYVVAHQSQTNQLLLIRYTADGSLDEAFGPCGTYSYFATGLSSSFAVTSGVYREESSRRYIYLSTLNNGKVTLVRLDIDLASSQAAYSTVDGHLGSAQIKAMMTIGTHMYLTGESGADLLPGESAASSPFRVDGEPNVPEAGRVLMVNPDGDYLYVVGNVQQGENDLVIRRYGLDGQRDDSFTRVIHTGIAGLDAVVKVVATNNVLSVFKYDPEDNQVVVRVFDWQGLEVGQHELLSSFTEGIAAHGLALDPNTGRVYFAGRHSGGTLSVESLVIPQLAISGSTTPLPTTTGPTESTPGWVWPTVGAAVVTVATVTVAVLGIVWAARHYSMSGDTDKP